MPLYFNPLTFSGTLINRPGPKTPGGKAVAARNATTHGLFSRDVVLPQLGEDPEAYEALSAALESQLAPQNLLERHYAEAIAAASWRLRRLHRWQAQVYEDETLTEDERLDRLDKVLRHETALHRQIDKAVKMLARDVPQLFEASARQRALADYDATEGDCRDNDELELEICRRTREYLQAGTLPPGLDLSALDNTHPAPETAGETTGGPATTEKCQNEPAADDDEWDDEEWDSEDEIEQDETFEAGARPTGRATAERAPDVVETADVPNPASKNDKTNPPDDSPPSGDTPAELSAEARARQIALLRANVPNALCAPTVTNRGCSPGLPAR